MTPRNPMRRLTSPAARSAASLLALGILATGLAAAASAPPTPATGRGPFYPPDDSVEMDNDLTRVPGGGGPPQGQLLELEGTLTDTEGRPVAGAQVVIWQTDIHGKYDHPGENRAGKPLDPNFQYWGKTTTDSAGTYRFRTVVPGSYGRRPAHVHMRFAHPEYGELATEMQFAGDPYLERDGVTGGLSNRDRLVVELTDAGEPGVKRAVYDVVLAGR